MRRLALVMLALIALVSACNVPLSTPFPDVPIPTRQPRATAPAPPVSTRPVAQPKTPAGLRVIDYTQTRPPTVTGTWAGKTCRVVGNLPDPFCTPGSIAPSLKDAEQTRADLCAPGFSAQVRPLPSGKNGTDRAKTAAMRAYGLPDVERKIVELDHLVPLWARGSNDATNLWPERSDIPNAGFRNRKDAIEDRVHDAYCRKGSKLRLEDVQLAFASDWTTALATLGVK